ncbi:hypothetical protein [Shivajiella indica]|uniref:Uncharacterized protein n=1 Tax=Shivajiella indica TaxID=872115 RepID=A0ABW5B5Q5_9BACT
MRDNIQSTMEFLKQDFELPLVKEKLTEEKLIQLLTPIVSKMLDREFEKLLNICYRVDLGENRLKAILHESPPENMAMELATALVKRQVQKIEIRQKYSK